MSAPSRWASSTQSLEESPEVFWEQFSAHAHTYPVSPEPLGSPLMEILTPLGPVFAFDRGLVPFSGQNVLGILHAQVQSWEASDQPASLNHLGGGRYEASGTVEDPPLHGYFCLHIQPSNPGPQLKLLLHSSDPPPKGQVLTAKLAPPLMVFRTDSTR